MYIIFYRLRIPMTTRLFAQFTFFHKKGKNGVYILGWIAQVERKIIPLYHLCKRFAQFKKIKVLRRSIFAHLPIVIK